MEIHELVHTEYLCDIAVWGHLNKCHQQGIKCLYLKVHFVLGSLSGCFK